MNRWWPLLRDIAVTGTGLRVILSQVYSPHPSGLLLGTGLALTVPAAAAHVKALLPGGETGESGDSSSSSAPDGPPPRQRTSGGTGE